MQERFFRYSISDKQARDFAIRKLLFLVVLADQLRLAGIGKNLLFFVRHYDREGEAAIIPFLTVQPPKIQRTKAFTADLLDRDLDLNLDQNLNLNLDRDLVWDLDLDLFPLFPVSIALG